MAYQVFARKYRPLTFEQILGQDHVVTTLRNAIDQDRIAQAYLFVGPRGTGKTTTARILAKALNCENGPSATFDPTKDLCQEIAQGNSLDVLEIDGASNNGVEQVRELREGAKFAPSRARYKIYYIDEVHMLSPAAFNALLKILEEPPPHVKFIFATTEPNKILATILSRCQRFDLRPIPDQVITDHLLHIAREERIELDQAAAECIARGAEGGMRDAQSMLDQLVAFCGDHIAERHVLDIFGFTAFETVASLTAALLEHRTVDALDVLHSQTEAGKELSRLLADLLMHLRNLLVYKVNPKNAVKDLSRSAAETLESQAAHVENERLLELVDQFAEIDARMKWAPNKKMHFELGIIRAVQSLQASNLSDVINVLSGALTGGEAVTREVSPGASVPDPGRAAKPLDPPEPPRETKKPPAPARAPLAPADPSEPPASADDRPAFSGRQGDRGAAALWEHLQQKFPLIFSQAQFGGVEADALSVRFHSTDFARERAASAKKEIETELRRKSGESLRLQITVDDTLPLGLAAAPPGNADFSDTPPFDAATPPQTPLKKKTPKSNGNTPPRSAPASRPASRSEESSDPPPTASLDEASFYNDDLIQKALDIFQAKPEKKDSTPD